MISLKTINNNQGYLINTSCLKIRFQVLDGRSRIVTGFINAAPKKSAKKIMEDTVTKREMIFKSQDIYQILYEREYSYR